MKTKYKWVRFEQNPETDDEWDCINTYDEVLGRVYYRQGWRQFIFLSIGAAYSEGNEYNFRCLEDIADFLKQLNKTKGCYKEDKGDAEK